MLRPGFHPVEICASEKLLFGAGLRADATDPRASPTERCVVPLGPGLAGAFEELGRRLSSQQDLVAEQYEQRQDNRPTHQGNHNDGNCQDIQLNGLLSA